VRAEWRRRIMGLIAAFALVSGVALVVGAFKLRSVINL
jgi:hypothetical protein